ncbi:MAG TPA: deaminase, partial [Bacteroidia bacterium]|nr:deaminase [Bacteroidia bacterium]
MESELSNKQKRYFNLAKKLSFKSDHIQHRLGCVIVKNNDILGIGFNKNRTHPKSMSEFRTLHAEVAAVVNAGEENLEGATAYIYRQTIGGRLGLSRPCEGCEALLK